ncbi:MAG: hypothetical protein JNK74_20825 [Candidatus Hydrogenedentes bacterium]|nr:hypothetical protein [Candidatus Hydrogenedentota bacterium]
MDSPLNSGALPSHWSSSSPRFLVIAIALVLAGVTLLFLLAALEARWLHAQPWSTAVWTEEVDIASDEAINAWSRTLTIEQSLGDSVVVKLIQEDMVRESRRLSARPGRSANPLDTKSLLNLDFLPRASLLMLDLAPSRLEPVLASGRLPVAGAREVLAGPLLSGRDVVLDGQTFKVTGQLSPQASGFNKVYVIPMDPALEPHFLPALGGTKGRFIADTRGRLETLIPELFDPALESLPKVHGGPVQTRPYIAWGIWLALLMVAVGSSTLMLEICRRLSRLPVPVLSHAMQEVVLRPRLIGALLLIFFGGFFGAMALGLADTELNYFFTQYASHEFTEGGLKYVGDAYDSGDISRAAHATFFNNFVMQTLLLSSVASLIPPFFAGLVKIMLSFVVVGFAMAPLWTETAAGMTYHAVTLGLELPPYVLTGFGAAVWLQYIWGFLWSPVRVWYLGDKAVGQPIVDDAARLLPRGLLVLTGCTAVSAVFLYVAAWYEAVTLISFR